MNSIIKFGDHSIVDNLNKDSIVFDCGSCLGEFTKMVYDKYKCRVFTYEPNTRLYNNLVKKLSNSYVTIINIGIGGDIGLKPFYIGKGIENSSFEPNKRELSGKMIEVNMTTIEREMELYNLDFIDVLKMDIEGAELDVIYKMSEDTFSKIGQISMEYHAMSKIPGYTQETVDKCDKYIIEKGFKRLTNSNIDRCYINENISNTTN